MTEALLVSNALLWLLVVALALVVVALARQLGVLHERVAPAGALSPEQGPRVGEPAPRLSLVDLSGKRVLLGEPEPSGTGTLLFFLSPTCPVCKTLLPTLRRVAAREQVRVVFASDGDPLEHADFLVDHRISDTGYVLSTDLGMLFQVAKLPYAVLIDEHGVLRAKGIVNTREHVESLFEASEHGVASIQEYLGRDRDALELAPTGTRS